MSKGNKHKMVLERDDDYGILKKALDVEIPDDFDPNKIPQNGMYFNLLNSLLHQSIF